MRMISRRDALGMLSGAVLAGCVQRRPESRPAPMRDELSGLVKSGQVPVLVALTARDGDVQVAALGTEREAIFRVASMTKPVIAAATMVLVESGKLRLDDPVDRLLPELADRRVLKRPDG